MFTSFLDVLVISALLFIIVLFVPDILRKLRR
jgi:hypothetical protein